MFLYSLPDLKLEKMPRSNKKKSALKPPPKHPPSWSFLPPSATISMLLFQEKKTMISRAIASGHKHGIEMKHGSSNPGLGDCAFESVIQNINDRQCFGEKYPMPIDYYRKIFVTDMFNRTVDTQWNIYSQQDWLKGWNQIGDLMLPGIACGVKKYLVIFNTSIESPHNPIYVVDPRQFNVAVDIINTTMRT